MITKRIGNKEYKLAIVYDECAESPREWQEEYSKMCIRKHRRYDFPNELNFDFDAYDNGELKLPGLNPNEYFFFLDCYIHSGISFSLYGEGQQCRFDTASKAGFLIVTLDDEGDKANGKAREWAQNIIEDYNVYLNGGILMYCIEEREILEKDGKEFTSDWEGNGWTGGLYSLEAVSEDVLSDYDIFTKEEIEDCLISN